MSEFEDAFNAAGRRGRRGGSQGGGNRHRGGRGGGRGISTIVMPGMPAACDCSQCNQQLPAAQQMSPVAAKMMAEQAAQVAADAAAKAAALNPTAAPLPGTPAPTSGIDGFDNAAGGVKKFVSKNKTMVIVASAVVVGIGAFLIYKKFKKA